MFVALTEVTAISGLDCIVAQAFPFYFDDSEAYIWLLESQRRY